ncbi:hypothetical protein HMPREF0004_4115 [Achromobacter piechaudii ATCC 43553]|uniref:Uncharacterized protein n=1 Tax=Achromobacter piechaudii ATCC 43553 TaxID=742159 RepID=D4XF68_9BURK|nr:hypothetical protein HMPREF0004_4115 [Achromobacter piechaudii ATCC 43553]
MSTCLLADWMPDSSLMFRLRVPKYKSIQSDEKVYGTMDFYTFLSLFFNDLH